MENILIIVLSSMVLILVCIAHETRRIADALENEETEEVEDE